MNAKERMAAAMALKPVDRVPNAPFYEAPVCRYFGKNFRRSAVFDNLNPNGAVLMGTAEATAVETRAPLEKSRGMTGYLFSTAGTMSPNTPRKNFEAMNREVLGFR